MQKRVYTSINPVDVVLNTFFKLRFLFDFFIILLLFFTFFLSFFLFLDGPAILTFLPEFQTEAKLIDLRQPYMTLTVT